MKNDKTFTNKNLIQAISQIEQELNVNSLTYKNTNIWPVIRISLLLSNKKMNVGIKTPIWKRIRFLLIGIQQLFGYFLGLWPKSKNVFLTSAHYKVKKEGKFYDRILDPFLNWLNKKGKDFVVFEFTNQYNYNQKLNYSKNIIPLQPVFYLFSFFWKLQFMLFPKILKKFEGNYDGVNKILKSHNINLRINNSYFLRIFLLEKQSQIFKKLLRDMAVTHVGIVCYYDFKSLGLTWACNQLKIPSIDFQHGVQGSLHLAYANWPKDLGNSSVFLPSHFWVWDDFSYLNISRWKKKDKIILGCNKWMQERVTILKPEIILYTVQPLEEPLPSYLLETIKDYSGDQTWFIRLHPQQKDEISRFINIIKQNNLETKVNITDATFLTLSEILSKTSVHITKSSSVAIESSYYDIPTIFIEKSGKLYYEDQLPTNLLYFVNEKNSVADLLQNIENNLVIRKNRVNTTALMRFKNIENFYN